MSVSRLLLTPLILGLTLGSALGPRLLAAEGDKTAASREAAETKEGETEDKEDGKKDQDDRYLVIQHGLVHTVTGPVLQDVSIVCKNGKIHAIGRSLEVPKEAETLDATGLHIYPGLIALSSRQLVGSGEPANSTDVFSLPMALGLAGGLSTVVSGNHAVKLTYGSLEGILLKQNVFETISVSSAASRRNLRKALERVRKHLRDVDAYEEKQRQKAKDAKKPDEKWIQGDYKKAMRLIKREAAGRAQASRVEELRRLTELAQQFGFDLVIDGAEEGWTMAGEISRAGAAVVVTPRARLDRDLQLVRPNGSTIENASILSRHGVPVAILPRGQFISNVGLAGDDLLHLPMEAAFAVRGGLPEQQALAAITIRPARMMRLAHRVGSIEVGKDADLVITDGPLLHYMSLARWTVVNGRVAYDKQKDTLFDHIRPQGDLDAPPPDDHWPRGLGEPW